MSSTTVNPFATGTEAGSGGYPIQLPVLTAIGVDELI